MEWLAENWWAGAGVIVTLMLGVVGLIHSNRQTRIALEEQAARREKDRRTEPPPPVPAQPAPPPNPKVPAFTNLPPDLHREIVGREAAVEALDAALARRSGAALTPAAALHAAGGMGKTSLARLYAKERRERFEGVWWLEAETEATLVAGIDALARRLGLAAEGDAKARAAAVWSAVESRGAPWLVVYDNAPSYGAVAPWRAWGAHVKLLVTSRQKDFPDAVAVLAVDALEGDAAAEVLEREAKRFDDRAGALRLAEALGGLPLALVQAGAYARQTTFGFDVCREKLVEIIERSPDAADYPASVAATLELSLKLIDGETEAGADEWALLRLMPWLAPEGIDAKLVLDISAATFRDPAIDVALPALRSLAANEARLQTALSRLAARALVSTEGEGPARRAMLHRVTALILRRRLAEEAGALRAAAAAAVAAGYPGGKEPQARANWPDCERLNPHVAALAEAADGPPATLAMEFLLNQASIYWHVHAEADRALAYARVALRLMKMLRGPDHPETASRHSNLNLRQLRAGDVSGALESGEEALRIARLTDDPSIGKYLSNVAQALEESAERKKAEGAPELASEMMRLVEKLERNAWERGRARLTTKPLIRRLPKGATPSQGDATGEATHLESYAIILSNLAKTWRAQGKPGKALCFGAAAVRLRRATLASGDNRLIVPLNNLGRYLLEARSPAAARPLLREALQICESAYKANDRHPDILRTANRLAACHFAPDEEAPAQALCAAYGLNADELRSAAARFRPA